MGGRGGGEKQRINRRDTTHTCIYNMVKPLSNRHIGMDHFTHYREVVFFGGKNVLQFGEEVSLIQRCPLFRVYFIMQIYVASHRGRQ